MDFQKFSFKVIKLVLNVFDESNSQYNFRTYIIDIKRYDSRRFREVISKQLQDRIKPILAFHTLPRDS